MANLTANANPQYKVLDDVGFYQMSGAAGNKIYQGALVTANATGYAVPAADTAAFVFLGFAKKESPDQASAVADGTNSVEVWKRYSLFTVKLAILTAVTVANIGEPVYVIDDQTVDLASGNSIRVGVIDNIVSANIVEVRIGA